MDSEKTHNGKRNGHTWNPVVIGVVSAILGSGGAISLVFGTPVGQQITRPDPFTGKQGAALTERIRHLEDDYERHVGSHPDRIYQFDRRITVLETQYSSILANQARIIERLDRINNK
jgi:hypothetical protein